jgi:dienelactone hydrolase
MGNRVAYLCIVAGLAVRAVGGQGEVVFREGLAIGPVTASGRAACHQDVLESLIVAGKFVPPKVGDTLMFGGTRSWASIAANKDGVFEGKPLDNGYVYVAYDAQEGRIALLEAAGNSMVYVNGEPRAGDPYSYGYLRLPIVLRKGRNDFLFSCARGTLRARLLEPRAPVALDTGDPTLPDFVSGERAPVDAGIVVINSTEREVKRLSIQATCGGSTRKTYLPPIPPLTVRKVRVEVPAPRQEEKEKAEVSFELIEEISDKTLDKCAIPFRIRNADQTYKRTFISTIDGTVQYYAVNPCKPVAGNRERPALVLSLHGASVEAIGQADAYSPKTWAHIVCPTNRRPYGFDWEDMGRLDALEVLENARRKLATDPSRTYLTGHSMGGHGTWQVGAQHPDLFAAIGPSAGWVSFWSYRGAPMFTNHSPIEKILMRAASPGDTISLVRNYSALGIYDLHGDADDNVPVTESRAMKRALDPFHKDFLYFEQPGAGHWWDVSDEPGADCVDWAPMFDFFARRRVPRDEEVRQIEFTTLNPAITSTYHWAAIEQQIRPMEPSSINLRFDPWMRRFSGSTENVAFLTLRVTHLTPAEPITVVIDGEKFEKLVWPQSGFLHFGKASGKWLVVDSLSESEKSAARSGPFKEVLRNKFTLVYSTKGSKEENAWSYAKARYDAEVYYYRGNGAVDIIPDTAVPGLPRERNVILYGNADTNAAWGALLDDSPVQVKRGSIVVGEKRLTGSGLACLFIRPRPGHAYSTVAVVSGTGIEGLRLCDRLPFLVSGCSYPDLFVIGPEMLRDGTRGVLTAGFFGNDWAIASGDIVWRD